jgi:DNA-binding HxlR family transcriptional regulator/putative sterol carrier protein
MEAVTPQKQSQLRICSVVARSYGQFCGLARALELVGERWALLIVRDLLVGPRRFTDLRQGLPRIPTNVLAERLKELEQAGVVRRRVLPRPAASIVYELTEYGSQLDDVVRRLGLWGAQSLGQPRPGEIMTADSMVIAMRSAFVPEAAGGPRITYLLRLGEIVLHLRIEHRALAVAEGEVAEADLVIEAGPAIKDLMSGELRPAEAIERGAVRVSGDAALLDRFVELFHIPTRPVSQAA